MECPETAALLVRAQDMARERFGTPTEDTVMRLFDRLCFEFDMAARRDDAQRDAEPVGKTLH